MIFHQEKVKGSEYVLIEGRLSRRKALVSLIQAAGLGLLAACAPAATPSASSVPAATTAPSAATKRTKVLWWSHWASEEPRKLILNGIAQRFQKTHSNVDVEIAWWQASELWPALRNAFTAGSGFPDIFYWDSTAMEFITAGWMADLTSLNWDQVEPFAVDLWKVPGPGGKVGRWAIPIEVTSDEIYYNKALFEKLGIQVPANYQFTADQFYDVCKKLRGAGYDPFAQGVGDRDYPGVYHINFALLAQLGDAQLKALWRGEKSWKDPEVVEALQYAKRLNDIPVMPATFSTMKLAEAHIYFHTQQKAGIFLCGSWYTGRAFTPPSQGGQPADFRVGFLRYPAMPKGTGNNLKFLTAGGSIAVADKSPNKSVAMELAQSIMTEETGNDWLAKSAIGTGLKTNPAKIDSPFKWYFDEYAKTHDGQQYCISPIWLGVMPPAMMETFSQVAGHGFPLRQVSVEDLVNKMEAARAKK
ncbi:MAG: ABC transporter substrate-binding protein [Chloroflexota bacterium]